jgi:hypothetical protein
MIGGAALGVAFSLLLFGYAPIGSALLNAFVLVSLPLSPLIDPLYGRGSVLWIAVLAICYLAFYAVCGALVGLAASVASKLIGRAR